MSENSIKRREVLIEMENKETRGMKPNTFSIQFYQSNGEVVYLLRARSVGLRANMTTNRLRGVQPVDGNGNAIGHVYSMSIDNIRVFNGQRVYL